MTKNKFLIIIITVLSMLAIYGCRADKAEPGSSPGSWPSDEVLQKPPESATPGVTNPDAPVL